MSSRRHRWQWRHPLDHRVPGFHQYCLGHHYHRPELQCWSIFSFQLWILWHQRWSKIKKETLSFYKSLRHPFGCPSLLYQRPEAPPKIHKWSSSFLIEGTAQDHWTEPRWNTTRTTLHTSFAWPDLWECPLYWVSSALLYPDQTFSSFFQS